MHGFPNALLAEQLTAPYIPSRQRYEQILLMHTNHV